jgi:hypothetical protein
MCCGAMAGVSVALSGRRGSRCPQFVAQDGVQTNSRLSRVWPRCNPETRSLDQWGREIPATFKIGKNRGFGDHRCTIGMRPGMASDDVLLSNESSQRTRRLGKKDAGFAVMNSFASAVDALTGGCFGLANNDALIIHGLLGAVFFPDHRDRHRRISRFPRHKCQGGMVSRRCIAGSPCRTRAIRGCDIRRRIAADRRRSGNRAPETDGIAGEDFVSRVSAAITSMSDAVRL